jgi:hypothetical protein
LSEAGWALEPIMREWRKVKFLSLSGLDQMIVRIPQQFVVVIIVVVVVSAIN